MPKVVIAPALARWLAPAPDINVGERAVAVSGANVREALEALFRLHPVLRGYVVDERGVLRHHVVAYVNGTPVMDKVALDEPVPEDGELYLFQALSGG